MSNNLKVALRILRVAVYVALDHPGKNPQTDQCKLLGPQTLL